MDQRPRDKPPPLPRGVALVVVHVARRVASAEVVAVWYDLSSERALPWEWRAHLAGEVLVVRVACTAFALEVSGYSPDVAPKVMKVKSLGPPRGPVREVLVRSAAPSELEGGADLELRGRGPHLDEGWWSP